MKLAFFDDFKLGVVADDEVVDVTDVVKDISRLGPQDVMRGLIERFDALKGKLADAAAKGQGKPVSQVKAADAMSYVFGYTNFIDGSARGVVPPTNVFYQMKSRDTFAPIGPYIVTADEIKDPHKLQVKLANNGVVMQNFNTDDMAHKIPRCIEWVTSIHTLQAGDILATGTNHRGLNPFMDGD